MRNWQDWLPNDLVLEVIKRIDKFGDYLRFEAICKSWQVVTDNFEWSKFRKKIPYLILGGDEEEREFYSITEHEVVAKIKRPCFNGRRCLESLGWLLTVGLDGDRDLTLLNPITGFEIEILPQVNLTLLNPGFDIQLLPQPVQVWYSGAITPDISKMILSSRPEESSNFALIIIKLGNLRFWRPGDPYWSCIQRYDRPICDITYFNNKLYAIERTGFVFEFDLIGSNPGQERIVAYDQFQTFFDVVGTWSMDSFICEFSGELLVIFKFYEDERERGEEEKEYIFSLRFDMYKINISSGRWEAIQSLGSKSLFIGQNQTKLIDTYEFGEFKANCIYHIRNTSRFEFNNLLECGVYNIETKKTESIYQGDHNPKYLQQFSPPLWCFCPPI